MADAQAWQQALSSARGSLPGGPLSATLREQALAAFDAVGFPHRRMEAWKYTDLKPLTPTSFALLPSVPGSRERDAVRALVDRATAALPGPRLVFIDGHLDDVLSMTTSHEGLQISSLAANWQAFERHQSSLGHLADHPLALLNTAFAAEGGWIKLAPATEVDDPVHLIFAGSGRDGVAPQPRVIIELGERSSARVVTHYLDAADSSCWINPVTEIRLKAGARLDLHRVQTHGGTQIHTALTRARLAADSAFTLNCTDLGGRLIRHDIDLELAEPGAEARLLGLSVASNGQHIDNHVRVDHIAPRTRSDETFRAIAGANGRGVFNGQVIVRKGADGTDARQRSDNLLLSEPAEIDTKPELEIYADDVKCSHGATVGELDEQQLYYLRSRGIAAEDARQLLTFAFANVVLERIAPDALRDQIAGYVSERLATEIGRKD